MGMTCSLCAATLIAACLAVGCGGGESPSSASPSPAGSAARHTGDDLDGSVFTQTLTEPEVVRFLMSLPVFADALEHARRTDKHPRRWEVQPLANPERNAYLWNRLGGIARDQFGPGFGETWLKVWAAFAALQARQRFDDVVTKLRARLESPGLSEAQKQRVQRQIEAMAQPDVSRLPLTPGPPENVELVRAYASELADLSARLFHASEER